jgi:hypothetical protein
MLKFCLTASVRSCPDSETEWRGSSGGEKDLGLADEMWDDTDETLTENLAGSISP